MQSNTLVRPWYRHFWVWVMIALPASVVIASIITIRLSIIHSDQEIQTRDPAKAVNNLLISPQTREELDEYNL